ncbi:Uncharacterised protein [Nocardia otitidiscaviarum]|uniref:Uncharacterized protein n=1 Tax=Nocardia otitidiscaviarum TaxID=1823 RepID=A0A379JLP2_9NOCA|nr:hypothetical protein [Nocardia otitidiscaviarum]SUD49360.1 Uncharacterised protein [Nocardia otitidiscaviarum]
MIEQARQGLSQWSSDCLANAAEMSDILGADADDYVRDPVTAFGAWQTYVDDLPFEELEHSDWVTLRTDLVSYLADILVRKFGAEWDVIADDLAPRGFRYVIVVRDEHSRIRSVDLFVLVNQMVASAGSELLSVLSAALRQLGIAAILRLNTR